MNAAAMVALADRKPIEWFNGMEWKPCDTVNSWVEHRPKHEPVSRPWSCAQDLIDTAGPLCWLRGRYDDGRADYRVHLVIGLVAGMSYNTCTGGCEPICHSAQFSETRWENMEWSSDLKTWKPCIIE